MCVILWLNAATIHYRDAIGEAGSRVCYNFSGVVDPRDPTLVSRQPAVLARGGSRILEEFGAKFGVERKNPRPNRGADREIRLLMMMAATLSCLPHLPQRLRRRAWGSLIFTG